MGVFDCAVAQLRAGSAIPHPRSQRTLQATRLAGQSNTARDIIKAIKAGNAAHPVSLLNKLALGAMGGFETHGMTGAGVGVALGLGEHILAAKRMAGLAKANTMVRDAMLNPELAMALLKRGRAAMTTPPLLMLAAGRRPRPRNAENSEVRPRDRNAEARTQAAVVEWIRLVAPDLIAFHVPNGGLRTKAEAARMKWVGVLAGVPDIVVLGLDGRCWLIEVKGPGGSLSPEQCVIRDRCVAMRIPFVVAKSIDDVRLAFRLWEIPTREASLMTAFALISGALFRAPEIKTAKTSKPYARPR